MNAFTNTIIDAAKGAAQFISYPFKPAIEHAQPSKANDTLLLLDVFIRKITGQKYISTADKPMPLLEARGYALNITDGFEKAIKQAALKSGISMHRLDVDFVKVQEEATKKIISGKFNEISGILKSHIEKICPGREAGCPGKLSTKKFDKFMAEFNSTLGTALNQSLQMLRDEKKLQNLGLSGPRSRLDDVLIVGNARELVAIKR